MYIELSNKYANLFIIPAKNHKYNKISCCFAWTLMTIKGYTQEFYFSNAGSGLSIMLVLKILLEIFSHSLSVKLWVLLLILDCLVSNVLTFQLMILIFWKGNFVCHHWRYTFIYRPLSLPLRSLRDEWFLRGGGVIFSPRQSQYIKFWVIPK